MRFNEKNVKRFGVLGMAVVLATFMMMAGNATAANWPEKGKLLTVYVPSGAGGGGDIGYRTMQPFLEEVLGTKTVIINKPGAAGQLGVQEYMAKAGTDGYTFLQAVLPNMPTSYLDPDRKATYTMRDVQLIANYTLNPIVIAAKKGGRYKTLKDLIEAAKANPNKIRVTAAGPLNGSDIGIFGLEKAAGVQFAHMFFDQLGEQRAALLGDHVDAESNNISEVMAGVKTGEIDVLGVLDDRESKSLPGVKTAEAQGYKAYSYISMGFAYKAGTPKEIVDTMAAAIQKVEANPDFQKNVEKVGLVVRVMVGKEYADLWSRVEGQVKGVLDELKKKRK